MDSLVHFDSLQPNNKTLEKHFLSLIYFYHSDE